MLLLNPSDLNGNSPDASTRELMQKTVDFFERKGKEAMRASYHSKEWYSDFLEFVRENRIFAQISAPADSNLGGARWDTRRNCEFGEILAFYGLQYWYSWQVSVLGLGPLWMSANPSIRQRTCAALDGGGIFAFGLSEKEHGADVYSSEMQLVPQEEGRYLARGRKYYIGNGNAAAMVSVFGKFADSNEYVFFAVDSSHERYNCIQNVCNSQSFVSEFQLEDYPVGEEDIIARGQEAWDAALNTVNIGKFNLGFASIGICTHAFYEALDHASNRKLYNMRVTDFPHVKRMFVDAYSRLLAMKIFGLRASDYMRSASTEDRRYLLYNPLVKMKVTTQGEDVINLLWDVIAAKGFEKETYFEEAAVAIRGLPKLEGTVHVNIALIIKFMANYFFNPRQYPEVPQRTDAANDDFLFDQGTTRGLGKIQFHDFRPVFESSSIPNVQIFWDQVQAFQRMLMTSPPDEHQQKNIDLLLNVGEIFSLVVYGQLILESVPHHDVSDAVVDQIFDFMVRDVTRFAAELLCKPSTSEAQIAGCRELIRKPAVDAERYDQVWNDHVLPLRGAYEAH